VLARLRATSLRRVLIVVLGALLVVLAAWGVFDLVRIQRDIRGGERILRSAKASDLARHNGLAAVADTAVSRLAHANRIARSSVPFKLVRPVPLFGHQVAVLRSMTAIASQVGVIGDDAARAVQAKLEAASQGPAGRVALLETAASEVGRAQRRLARLHVKHDGWALPPLRGQRVHLANSLANARTRLRDVGVMVGGLQRMFVGPSRYLILAGNNAEMRAGGMPLSAGVAEIRDGAIGVSKFTPTADLFLAHASATVPQNLKDLYGWMAIGYEWRATTATPNFPASAAMYSQMAPLALLGNVDGVIFVDVLTLGAVVAATGPVELDGTQYNARNIEQQMMNENYIRFGDPSAQTGRYDLQSRVGVAVFDAMNSRPLKLGPLVSNLSAAGKGRHLLAWSTDPALRMVFERAGIDGRLNPNGLMINLQNISANKLDWYLRPRISLRTLSVHKGVRRVELSVTFTNKKRTRTSDVVEGVIYDRTHGMADGEHRAYLVAYLPKTAFDVGADDPPFSTIGIDDGLKVVGFHYGVKIGETRTVRITFSVPERQVFLVIPSARAHPVSYFTPSHRYTDAQPVAIKL
jgi:hypothetical protein